MQRALLIMLAVGLASPASARVTTYKPAAGEQRAPGLGRPAPSTCPGGYWARQRTFDRWGNPKGWSHPRFVCP
ncbi:MAG: hypothetical protein ACK4UO_09015 [Pseudolabrys sp.]